VILNFSTGGKKCFPFSFSCNELSLINEKIICVFLFFLVQHVTFAQQTYFNKKKDSSGFSLTDKGVAYLSSLPLKCILQEFPYKTSHTSVTDSDHVLLPKQLHPAFYGCF
jgi:hypothetical protein